MVERVRAKQAPIEVALEYAQTSALLERLKEHELDARSSARQMRERLEYLEKQLQSLVEQDGMRVFQTTPETALVVYSHSYGGQEWRMVKFVRMERLEA